MSIQFSGIMSGLPVGDIIDKLIALEQRPIDLLKERKSTITTERSQYKAVSSRISSLKSALSKLLDAQFGSSMDLFEAKKPTSSDTGKLTATADNSATEGSYQVDILNLATATRSQSLQTIGTYTDGATLVNKISNQSVTDGTFTVYVNNQARSITVDKDADTMQDVVDAIATEISTVTGQAASGILTATGKIELSYAAGTNVQFGASGDSSNFAKLTFLTTGSANVGQDTFTAQYGTNTLDKTGTLLDNDVGLQNNTIVAGTFTIGGATFTIDANTTLSGLMGSINSNSEAGVSLSYNTTTNKMEMVSKKTGNQAITLDDGGTGFLQSVGLINGTDTLSSQTLGTNAKFTINGGVEIQSTSNDVDSATSGLTGVTLNLLAETAGSPITLDIKRNTDELKSAVSDFITKFNSAISFIDEQTKKDAVLNGENSLTFFRATLRKQISDSVDFNSTYKILSQIGISTGAVDTSPTQGSVSSTFTFNESKFLEALADDPDEVKKLLIGNGTDEGILGVLKDTVDSALDPEFGLFSSRDESANDQIKSLNEAIERGEVRLEAKEKQLRAQFTAMESMITQLQQQQSSINSLGIY